MPLTDDEGVTAAPDPRAPGLLEAVGHAVVATDDAGTVAYWNAAAQALFGWTASEAIGHPILDLIDPGSPDTSGADRIARIVAGETICEEYLVQDKDGRRFPVRVTAQPWRDADGCTIGIVGTSVDVTDSHRTAAYLNEATRLAELGIWELDLDAGRVVFDQHVARLWGLPPSTSELGVDDWFRLVHRDDRPRMLEMGERMRVSSELPEMAYRVVRSDGSSVHVVGRGTVLERKDGAPWRIGGVLLDVSEAQRTEREVLELLEHLSDGYYSLDTDLRFTYVNRRAEEMFRVQRDKLLGRTAREVFGDVEGGRFHGIFRSTMETGEPWEDEIHFTPWGTWYLVRVSPSRRGVSVTFQDCTERHLRAKRDPLTELPNRQAVEEWLAEQLADHDNRLALFLLDLDRFKYINDSLGHGIGDALLLEIARRLRAYADGSVDFDGIVGRVGGDEFVVVGRLTDVDAGRAFLARLLETVRAPIDLAGRHFVLTTSIGIAHTGVRRELTATSMLRDADAALYRAKEGGGNRAASFDETLHERAVRRVELEAELRRALDGEDLRVVYQPAFGLADGLATGAEALVRWYHPDRGVIAPNEFIPMAEETGLIIPLGERVLDLVARHLRSRDPEPGDPPFTVWVNVSAAQFNDPAFFERLASEPMFLGGRLGLEVTETMLLQDPQGAAAALNELSEAGVKVAIDDFGTGYSSLARLPRYPFDLLKIDQSFVRGTDDPAFRAIVAATIQLGHGLQKRVLAEGVETPEELHTLRRLGCDEVSGFYLARPVPPADLLAAMRQGVERLAGTPKWET